MSSGLSVNMPLILISDWNTIKTGFEVNFVQFNILCRFNHFRSVLSIYVRFSLLSVFMSVMSVSVRLFIVKRTKRTVTPPIVRFHALFILLSVFVSVFVSVLSAFISFLFTFMSVLSVFSDCQLMAVLSVFVSVLSIKSVLSDVVSILSVFMSVLFCPFVRFCVRFVRYVSLIRVRLPFYRETDKTDSDIPSNK